MTDVIRWMTWLSASAGGYLERTAEAFRKALKATLECSLAREWDRLKVDVGPLHADLTDNLQKALPFLESPGRLDLLEKLIAGWDAVKPAVDFARGHPEDEYYKGAREEFGGEHLPAGTEYLLYGHTHAARQVCFSAKPGGEVQMYINTGTFLPLIERTADRQSFFRSNRMTFICFYRKDEDTHGRLGDGPTVDVWDGIKRKDYVTA
jgi:hypothetical protein